MIQGTINLKNVPLTHGNYELSITKYYNFSSFPFNKNDIFLIPKVEVLGVELQLYVQLNTSVNTTTFY